MEDACGMYLLTMDNSPATKKALGEDMRKGSQSLTQAIQASHQGHSEELQYFP